MIPASTLERANRVAVCTCGEMVLRFGTLKDIVFDITRRGWEYRFADEIDAARAYDAAALEHFGEFANTNFADKEGSR